MLTKQTKRRLYVWWPASDIFQSISPATVTAGDAEGGELDGEAKGLGRRRWIREGGR